MIVGNIKSHDPLFALWFIPKTRNTGETEVTHHNTITSTTAATTTHTHTGSDFNNFLC